VLGESVIDFSNGEEGSGLAPDGAHFIGERPGGLADVAPKVMEKLDPVLAKVTATLDSLQKTSDNLAKLSAEGADLPAAFAEFKEFGKNLNDMSTYGGPLRNSLQNIETLTSQEGKLGQTVSHLADLTGPEGSLARTFKNAEKFTADLTANDNAAATLRNFRNASDNLDKTLTKVGQQFGNIGNNLEQASDTLKKQPWRLIWPTTKKYLDEPSATPTPKPGRPAPRKLPGRN
jgi:ABC-type transporter Mla subunit MlaD